MREIDSQEITDNPDLLKDIDVPYRIKSKNGKCFVTVMGLADLNSNGRESLVQTRCGNMNLDEYYREHYLPLHMKTMTRLLHLIGVIFTFVFIVYGVYTYNFLWILLAPFVIYPFAWTGHLVFERNKPAAWTSPIYAKLSDLRMCWEILTGKI